MKKDRFSLIRSSRQLACYAGNWDKLCFTEWQILSQVFFVSPFKQIFLVSAVAPIQACNMGHVMEGVHGILRKVPRLPRILMVRHPPGSIQCSQIINHEKGDLIRGRISSLFISTKHTASYLPIRLSAASPCPLHYSSNASSICDSFACASAFCRSRKRVYACSKTLPNRFIFQFVLTVKGFFQIRYNTNCRML